MESLEIYTDGACSGNHVIGIPRRAGIGIVMVDEDEVVWEHSMEVTEKISPDITNNRAELYAVLYALRTFADECEGYDTLIIHTDSKYVVDIFGIWLEGWRKSGKDYKNRDLIDAVDALLKELRRKYIISIHHVRGHSTNKFNNLADKLSVDAISSSSYIN